MSLLGGSDQVRNDCAIPPKGDWVLPPAYERIVTASTVRYVTGGSSHLACLTVTIPACHPSKVTSRADRHHPGTIRPRNSRPHAPLGLLELPSMWKRLRRLLLRWQAPQPNPAHREDGRTRPDSGGPRRVRQPLRQWVRQPLRQSPRPRWRTLPRLWRRRCRRQEPLRGASRPQKARATGPPWGRGASAPIPFVSQPAVWSRLRRRSIHSAGRLPHGALAISAHLRRAAALRRRLITTMPPSGTDGSSQPVTGGTSHSACSACDDPSRDRVVLALL
jgi:hypothetical protein